MLVSIDLLYLILAWAFLLLFYSYLGYGLLLYAIVNLKNFFYKNTPVEIDDLPDVTLVVAAYNEEVYIEDKIHNSLQLDYPASKLKLLFVTDGSDDQTMEIIRQYPQVQLEHQPERQGKITAVDRIMPLVKSPITIYTDANTHLNQEAVKNIVKHFANPKVGGVAGEKRIRQEVKNDASSAGEGVYWKYESALKKWDYKLYSVVGAAGELFAIRTELYEPVRKDTLIEDFYMTLRIAQRGYRVAYEKEAYAIEDSSASIQEEMKRKIRIAAGGIQAIIRLATLLIPYPNPILTFQYVSHRVLRWTLAPIALLVFGIVSVILATQGDLVGKLLVVTQVTFYGCAYVGYRLERKKVSLKALYIPLYFSIMNLAVYRGAWRLWKGQQSVVWEKAQRKAKV
uniref:Glycosyltransferase family 2 protein n=1 Tax=Roseihalotalea indica TaxID=2867963 RepID=A0AA49GIU7_9BACT|nr:glycosyltransferase family 2 protein [Tunicatimonas sp. TK19036]